MIETSRRRWTSLTWMGGCIALFVVLAVLVRTGSHALHDLDHNLGRWPHQYTYDHHWARQFFNALSYLTSTWPMIGFATIVVGSLVFKKHRRAAIWTAVTMTAAGLSSTGLKQLVHRDRPRWDHSIQTLGSYSFPSGHATGIAAAAGVAIVLAVMLIRRRSARRLIIATAISLALLVGADRVFLGVHFASDVLAGYLVGAVVVLIAVNVFDPEPRSLALTSEPQSDTVPPNRRKVAAILNPIKVDDAAGFRAMVEKMAAESGWAEVAWWHTTAEDTGYRMAHEAAVSGADLVIAIGGDGTIRAVCEELAGTGIPVAIVPAGTGNLLARNLDIPLYLRAAVDVGLNGQDRAIDMVRVSGDAMEDATYLVMAGMGFDAAMMEGVNEDFKKKVGWLAYAWSALKALMFPAIRVEVSIDGGEFTKHRARTIVIGNVGNLQAGMPLIPNAAIDDGRLDVVLLYPRWFLSWVPLAARIMTKDPRTDELITRMTGRTVVVRASAPAPRQLDGDLIKPGRELHAVCEHGRLLVRVPR